MSEQLTLAPERDVLAQSFEFYKGLLESQNTTQPHRQGLSQGEFIDALNDPQVLKTPLESEGNQVEIPQLSPIDRFEWLNTEFYYKKFPVEGEHGDIKHFADFKGVEPGTSVQEGLIKLAKSDGVLVFDFPATDPEAPVRIHTILENLGITAVDAQLLGTQTYFAGQVGLKNGVRQGEAPIGLIPAFRKMVDEGSYDVSRLTKGASLKQVIDPEQARHINRFYDEAFEVINDHPCKQGLSPEEFVDMVSADDEVAKIVNTRKGEIAAVCIMGDKLEKFNWINPEFYEQAYPDKAEHSQIVYFPALAANPEAAGSNTLAIVNLIAELVEAGNNEMIVAFDCCDTNNGFLDAALNAMINRTPEATIDIEQIGVQYYGALKLSIPQNK